MYNNDFLLSTLPLIIVLVLGIRMTIRRFKVRKRRVSRILTLIEAFDHKNDRR